MQGHFRDIFKTLFEGGDAELRTIGEDPLECEIEIVAKPRGKHLQSISLMSGGERALTAIALLFAIYLVKPSPFCLLDEVDAPLDDANVERFIRMLRRFSDRTQFVVITHNKKTMEAAEALYGVTMQELGVSRLVSVRFDAGPRPAATERGEQRASCRARTSWRRRAAGLARRDRRREPLGPAPRRARRAPASASASSSARCSASRAGRSRRRVAALEEALLAADVGPATAERLIERAEQRMRREPGLDLRAALERTAAEMLAGAQRARSSPAAERPWVALIVGVNGVGKTTLAGKLAAALRARRPAARCWSPPTRSAPRPPSSSRCGPARAGVELVRARDGADPAAVVHDALARPLARGARDVVLVDTAGRLHTKHNLMAELEKVAPRLRPRRCPARRITCCSCSTPRWARTASQQAREFQRAVPVTSLAVTKLDGTARGGAVLAIADELRAADQRRRPGRRDRRLGAVRPRGVRARPVSG